MRKLQCHFCSCSVMPSCFFEWNWHGLSAFISAAFLQKRLELLESQLCIWGCAPKLQGQNNIFKTQKCLYCGERSNGLDWRLSFTVFSSLRVVNILTSRLPLREKSEICTHSWLLTRNIRCDINRAEKCEVIHNLSAKLISFDLWWQKNKKKNESFQDR